MRRNNLRLLANLLRFALLGVGVTAAGTAVAWNWRSDLVRDLQNWLVRRQLGSYHAPWQQLKEQRDPNLAEQQLTALVARLDHVRRRDHASEILEDCLRRLTSLAQRRGDLPAAIDWMRQLVQFNDQDLHSQVRLADLLCAYDPTRDEGLQRLTDLNTRFPGSLFVAPAFARNLLAAGLPVEAALAVVSATSVPRSRFWRVMWHAGRNGKDRPRVGTVAQLCAGETQLRFQIGDPLTVLRLRPPAFQSAVLLAPQLRAVTDGREWTLDLSNPEYTEVFQIRQTPGRLTTTGKSGPWIEVKLPQPIPRESLVTFAAHIVQTPSAALADLVQSPEFEPFFALEHTPELTPTANAMRLIRAMATANDDLQVFWSGPDNATFSGENSVHRGLESLLTPAGIEFDLELPLPAAQVGTLRIDLPEGKGIRYLLQTVELIDGGDVTPVDAATIELLRLHSLERHDGCYTVTGSDPYCTFAVPGGPRTIRTVRVKGLVQ